MTFYVEDEINYNFGFSVQEIGQEVAIEVLRMEQGPQNVQVNLLITNNEGIREFNQQFRNLDKETDVLSFPNVEFENPGDFSVVNHSISKADYYDLDSDELILGDIIISVDRILSQSEEYGHSTKREFAFLVAHSMLHLCGYDHMVKEEAKVMEEKQEKVLTLIGITRDN